MFSIKHLIPIQYSGFGWALGLSSFQSEDCTLVMAQYTIIMLGLKQYSIHLK